MTVYVYVCDSLVFSSLGCGHTTSITIHITVMSVTLCQKCHYANVNSNVNGIANGNVG